MGTEPMSPAPGDPGQLSSEIRALVVRAWLEQTGTPRIRVRIAELIPGREPEPVLVTVSVEEACQAVRGWLEALPRRGAGGTGDGGVTHGR